MTSLFTLDISQFRTNAEGKLDLGYVSYIICKDLDIIFLRTSSLLPINLQSPFPASYRPPSSGPLLESSTSKRPGSG
jgi:hypothetical protein